MGGHAHGDPLDAVISDTEQGKQAGAEHGAEDRGAERHGGIQFLLARLL